MTGIRDRVRIQPSLGGLLWLIAAITMFFLYAPIAVVIVYSFTESATMSYPIDGWSLEWYGALLANDDLHRSLANSLLVAGTSAGIALVLGIPAALALDRATFAGKRFVERILVLPFVLPGMVLGVALLSLFKLADVRLSLLTVIAVHSTLLLAVVIIQMGVGLKRWDRTLEEAAMDLGANEWRVFWRVLLPNMRNVIVGAVLLGFTLSLDEITRTFFVTGTDNTLPMHIFSMMRERISPEINAVATLLFGGSVLAFFVTMRLSGQRGGQR